MTNYERWRSITEHLESPDNYIDFGFYYTTAAFIQRRVFTGPKHEPLYCNLFCVLVGGPGIGKGRVIRWIEFFLKHFKIENPKDKSSKPSNVVGSDPAVEQAAREANYAQGESDKNKGPTEKLVIPLGSDASTYEALCMAVAKATRYINYIEVDKDGKRHTKIYAHASLAFCLEELSSLFRKHTNDVANFLIKAYDAGDYDYETKTQGVAKIRKCCLNFFGGTQPSFIQTIFNEKILTEGFASRTWFIYASKKRKYNINNPELTETQLQAVNDLIAHFGKLTKLYGQVKFSEEAWKYIEHWYCNVLPENRPNESPKLDAYYARKNMHLQKLAMILHLSEDAEMNDLGQPLNDISVDCVKKAQEILDREERSMHYALNFDSKNPLANVGRKMINYILDKGPQSKSQLLTEFFDDAKASEQDEILTHLLVTDKLGTYLVTYPGTNQPVKRYDVVERNGAEPMKYLRERINLK